MDGHRRYLVECDNCMEVFKQSGLPKLGTAFDGFMVTGMTAERLREGLYVVTLTVEKEGGA